MTCNLNRDNCVNGTGTICGEGVAHGKTQFRCRTGRTVSQLLHQPDSEFMKFRTCSLNVGSLHKRESEVVEMLERRSIDVCCVQEVGYKKERGVKFVVGKECRYKLFWIGKTGLFLAEKWVENVFDVCRVSDRIIVVKLMLDSNIVTIVSVYAPQSGLEASEKDHFYNSLIDVASKFGEKESVILGGDFNGHVGRIGQGYEGIHGGYGYGDRNREGERILDFCAALNMFVGNTYFKKKESHLVTFESGSARTQIDYFLFRQNQRKYLCDVKVIPSEECITQHKPVVCVFKIRKLKSSKRKFIPKRKVWKLGNSGVVDSFIDHMQTALGQKDRSDLSVEGQWKVLKDSLIEATERSCGWTKGPPRHRETWWWNEAVDQVIKVKRKLWKEWKAGRVGKEVYLEAKRRAKRAVYEARTESERKKFGNIENRDDQKQEVFRIAKTMVKDNRDIIGEQCIRNDDGVLAVTEEDKKVAWKSYYEGLLNTENQWDRKDLSEVDPVISAAIDIDKDMVRKAIKKMKIRKAAGPSGVAAEMIKASGEVGVDMITGLLNKIVRDGVVPAEWELSTIVNCYKGKGDALERGNYRGLKLTDQVLKVMERVVEQLIRRIVNIDQMQFGFMPGRGTTDAIFVLRQLQEKYLAKRKNLYFAFVDLEKAFDRVPRDVVWWAMRKLGVDEWIVNVVKAMYSNSRSQVRINNEFSEEFLIKVGVHQGSVLSPLLFIIVLEALTREMRSGCPEELLYADDLVLMGETVDLLKAKLESWKHSLESGGLRVNLKKTKIMVSGCEVGEVREQGKYPCGVCHKGVGVNSLYCKFCKHWVHKRCSKVRGRLQKNEGFKCSSCRDKELGIRQGEEIVVECGDQILEVVDRFCYLGDTIGSRGGACDSVTARIRSGWNKFRELVPLLASKGLSLAAKGRLFQACVRSVMLYASETWQLKEEDLSRLERADASMIRWMCRTRLSEHIASKVLRGRLGLVSVRDLIQTKRLRWFGHVERMDVDNWVSKCRSYKVEGRLARGRPKKTWFEAVRKDLRERNINRQLALDRKVWKSVIKTRPTHACMD